MRVGIIGSGEVGRALGRGFANAGHDVKLGTRGEPNDELLAWAEEVGSRGSVGSFAEAAVFGETVVLAVRGAVAESALELAGRENLSGKLLIDVTNPLDFSKGMPPGLLLGTTDSLGERLQRAVPEAKVVKCFNIVGNPNMVHPRLPGGPPDMIICGNDAAAKKQIARILADFGWPPPIDIGGIDGARWLEALVPLWVRVGAAIGSFNHAFKVLRG